MRAANTESNHPSKRSIHNHDYLMLHKLEMSKFIKSIRAITMIFDLIDLK